MDQSFSNFLGKAKAVLILLPLNPNLDQVAAGLSLYLALREESDVQIYSPSAMIVEFNRLVGVNKITQELGNKNLTIEFEEYKANDIERVSYDIKDGQFKLTVIPKQKLAPPSRESVKLSYSGLNVDAAVIIGGKDESSFPDILNQELGSASIAHVGNTDINLPSDKGYISFSRPASSVSEVMFGLIKETDLKVNEDIATNLIWGIEKSTNRLSSDNIKPETFSIMAELLKLGGKRPAAEQVVNDRTGNFRANPFLGSRQTAGKTVFAQNPVRHVQNQDIGGEVSSNSWQSPKV